MKLTAYWDQFSSSYESNWYKYDFRKILNQKEQKFIHKAIADYSPEHKQLTIIDLGCGSGRIVESIIQKIKKNKTIIALDSSQKMISLCKRRFKNSDKIKLFCQNITQKLPVKSNSIDTVICVRVLKYNRERDLIFHNVSSALKPMGIFVFTITNIHSIAFFDQLPVRHYKDSYSIIEKQLNKAGLTIKQAEGFQRFPEFVYKLCAKINKTNRLFELEKILNRYLGDVFLSRVLYVTAQKQ